MFLVRWNMASRDGENIKWRLWWSSHLSFVAVLASCVFVVSGSLCKERVQLQFSWVYSVEWFLWHYSCHSFPVAFSLCSVIPLTKTYMAWHKILHDFHGAQLFKKTTFFQWAELNTASHHTWSIGWYFNTERGSVRFSIQEHWAHVHTSNLFNNFTVINLAGQEAAIQSLPLCTLCRSFVSKHQFVRLHFPLNSRVLRTQWWAMHQVFFCGLIFQTACELIW